MRISEQEEEALQRQMRRIGLFYCTACKRYFRLEATRSGLAACPGCGAPEEKVFSVRVGAHDDNDLDDDYV
ncbi:MAG: hypothetical protein DBX44_00500 [Oscillospiraceae bacterium]|nr:MAG: hypothetical protein DBX44_00500 [Oscillospiraceae bacterium]